MDTVLNQAMEVLHRAKTLVQQGSTGTSGDEAREAIATEMEQLREQMVLIGNSEYGGRYMFNGQKTDVAPYSLDNAPNESTNKGVFRLNVAPGISVPVSITGEAIFGEAGSEDNVFKVLEDTITTCGTETRRNCCSRSGELMKEWKTSPPNGRKTERGRTGLN